MANHANVHLTVPIEWRGEKYLLTRPTFLTESQFCKYLSDRAIDGAKRSRLMLGEDGFEKAIAAWQRDYAAGIYSWGSHIVERATKHEETFKELILMILHQKQPGLEREEFAAMWKDCMSALIDAFNQVMSSDPTIPPQPEGAENH